MSSSPPLVESQWHQPSTGSEVITVAYSSRLSHYAMKALFNKSCTVFAI